MPKITITDHVSGEHPNHMQWVDDEQRQRHMRSGGLSPYKVCLVEVCGFQFIFHSVLQLELTIEYYERPIHPTSRLPVHTQNLGGDHWETQRWFEKLPMTLLGKSKRPRVIAALRRALGEYGIQPGARTSTSKPRLWGNRIPN